MTTGKTSRRVVVLSSDKMPLLNQAVKRIATTAYTDCSTGLVFANSSSGLGELHDELSVFPRPILFANLFGVPLNVLMTYREVLPTRPLSVFLYGPDSRAAGASELIVNWPTDGVFSSEASILELFELSKF